ncbi:3-hydroxyacyl-ACP dehydratase FabZ [Anaerosalibacter bizertensis]|uniref:3-hydroxyacyl-[acyl-carrier-protein] dehydratase FabZ n=2 Tax=Anaerosalibacter bizertensis TaxID=932217 RepID=A0A9Q4AD55_9FIRM|nr:3-hydroxyacyl-ACP dehydratase FabZ [Anaerosalibacter bizertensis]MBV1818202.1 3-hydroxyacyl-ACP dehydratase FabZ [Bacteroidales bacterium MSK.15.36]MBU5293918.1 3-hydroxyacyl-ACP dehydratase FabZ [Anaerosalibacter bizertensis]MCB5560097.1 3-hydroxyacyl-ACP dehydratase FabZ [Anaerosalibacter bizertensis]MCG4565436.1 3-hydroxyacyl-ACP dehydratase FabZ [Anaerosalibacter bizertensis]MCG4582311.1 3-hydroxyacyl-ACP dehydratase FabZ [Anaerosalibacter bizertensis]
MSNMLNINDIKEILPHRYPFLLVDKINIVSPGEKVIGYKNVTINEPFFQGHFPQEPVMPGVLIIEAMAQTGAVLVLSEEKFKGKTPYFVGLNKVKFRKKVIPGDTLKMEVETVRMRSSMGVGKAKAYVENKLVAEGELMFAIG